MQDPICSLIFFFSYSFTHALDDYISMICFLELRVMIVNPKMSNPKILHQGPAYGMERIRDPYFIYKSFISIRKIVQRSEVLNHVIFV